MADQLVEQVAEAVAYLNNNPSPAVVFCVLAPFLLDPRSYNDPDHKPAYALKSFVHEGTLTSEAVQKVLRENSTFTRFLYDGKFGPSAFGLPIHPSPSEEECKYHVCISYASEDQATALRLARQLKKKYSLEVFFDQFEQHKLTGHRLTEMLYAVYARDSILCVPLLSRTYIEKDWTRHELQAARDRAVKTRGRPYIFPVILENGVIPEDLKGVFCWFLKPGNESKLAEAINERVGDWFEQNTVTLEEFTNIFNYDTMQSAILDGFRVGMTEAQDPEFIQALWVFGLLAAVKHEEVITSMNALLDFVVTSIPSLSNYFDEERKCKIFGSAYVVRSLTKEGPLGLTQEGWSSFIPDRFNARRDYFDKKAAAAVRQDTDDEERLE